MGLASEDPGKCKCFRDYLHPRGHLRHPRPRRVALATMVQRRRRKRIRPNIDGLLSHSDGEIVSYLWVRVSASTSSYFATAFQDSPFPFFFFLFFDYFLFRIRGASRALQFVLFSLFTFVSCACPDKSQASVDVSACVNMRGHSSCWLC
jgi:hypothetical protein